MKAILIVVTLAALTSCSIDWKKLGTEAGQAAIDATAPIVVKHVTTPPAKQPLSVTPNQD